jgi:hypothetical protein
LGFEARHVVAGSISNSRGCLFCYRMGPCFIFSFFPSCKCLTFDFLLNWQVIYHQSPPSPPMSFQPAPPAPFSCAQSSGPDGCLFVIGGKRYHVSFVCLPAVVSALTPALATSSPAPLNSTGERSFCSHLMVHIGSRKRRCPRCQQKRLDSPWPVRP